ncbi:MAG: aminotransferase class V-fold PLP-dependent enzyme [Holophagaceae bacterium]|nr:aminotransferase class V-fold PLP-dependent enzyme [Holophagaceae bacterium]
MDWQAFRRRFPLPEDESFFNTGTLGCPAISVIERLYQSQHKLAETIAHWEYLNDDREWITGYTPEKKMRTRLGNLFGADPSEISLTQNATMGINFIANGLDWQPGDEVIQTDQEHPGARCPWEVLVERRGIVLKQVHLPIPLSTPEEIINRIESAITARTKMLSIPHITSGLGTVLPVKELCALARARGVYSLVDGAQVPGHIMLSLDDIVADAYSASLHKWLFAPAGLGFLHIKREFAKKIWPTQASEAWRDSDSGFRFQQRGTGNPSILHALDTALDIFEEVGQQNWCRRVKNLGDKLRHDLQEIPALKGKLRFNSSLHPELCAGITSVEYNNISSPNVVRNLWDNYKIRVRDVGDPYGLRISTAAYTQESEINNLVLKLGELN